MNMGMSYRRERDDEETPAILTALTEHSPSPVVELDPQGLTYANLAALSLLPDLPEIGEEHPFISGIRRIASGIREAQSHSGTGEVMLNESRYRLDVSLVPETGGLRVYATELADSRRLLKNVLEHAADALFLHDLEGHILEVNQGACESLGYGREELLSFKIQDIETLAPEALFSLWESMTADDPVTVYGRHRRKDGTTFPVEIRLALFEERGMSLILAMARDDTERKETQRLLAESERRFRQLFDRSVEAMFLHDTEGRIVDCNAEACHSLGYTREELLSLSVEDFAMDVLSDEERRRREETPWRQAVRLGSGSAISFHENEHKRKDGTTFPVEVGIGAIDRGEGLLVLASARDISVRRLLEEELTYRDYHDPLTGLPNHEMLDTRLKEALSEAERLRGKIPVMLLHLGGLDRARERLGYRAGNRLLKAAAQRVRGCLGLEDTVGRPDGDELAVLAESATDDEQAVQTALDILEDPRSPLEDGEFQAEPTIGIALAPSEAGAPNPLDAAYEALCQARRSGELYEIFR